MPESRAEKVIRLRREAEAAERYGRQLLKIAVLIGKGRHYDIAIEDYRAMIAQVIALSALADQIELECQTVSPEDSN